MILVLSLEVRQWMKILVWNVLEALRLCMAVLLLTVDVACSQKYRKYGKANEENNFLIEGADQGYRFGGKLLGRSNECWLKKLTVWCGDEMQRYQWLRQWLPLYWLINCCSSMLNVNYYP
jgi:hypothetical protein